MTKPKAGADAPVEEQPIAAEQAAPIEDEASHEQPSEGGSYVRNLDGSLTRVEEA